MVAPIEPVPAPGTLAAWLSRIEGLHPSTIEMGLARVGVVAQRLQLDLSGRVVITVGGTNGKGSTCALMEAMLLQAGYRVGLYTSPHLIDFNERVRLDGVPVDDARLVAAFERVEAARVAPDPVALTYFEFTTLAALLIFREEPLDAVILEVGLGGRLDAVNLIDADCAIVTSIDIDHQEYLGETREKIGWEKAHIFRPGRPAICADPVPPQSLIDHAQGIGADLRLFGRDFNYAGDKQQWSFGGRSQRRNAMAYPAIRGANQLLNASAVLAALEALADRLVVPQQAVRQGLATVALPGRFQVLAGRPTTILDVGHNPHAAAHLARNLDSMGFHPRSFAIFGAMKDKDLCGIVRALGDRIDHWLLVALPGARAASLAQLEEALAQAGVHDTRSSARKGSEPRSIRSFADVGSALATARGEMDEADRIVVFGSFVTVAEFLRLKR